MYLPHFIFRPNNLKIKITMRWNPAETGASCVKNLPGKEDKKMGNTPFW
jgi:hypothetical protein